VIISEDGGFYYHKGFDAEGFSVALARNIKDRRLARGGSTITMQLVKNLYLNRQKNLVRKAEEALVVWLIETQKLVSKERILEIYLNIIDWGPNINGIDEAARYYFNKEPIDIELNEAIFLAGIIPQPARFMSYFDCDQNLKEYMQDYYNFIGSTMLQRSMITEEELLGLQPSVNINGSAQDLLSSGCE
jgi:membrane peptidoglycan carboxypeptidase